MGLDLSKPADFARATMSPVASVLLDLAGRDPTKWDILEGAFNGVRFHVFQSKEPYGAGLAHISDTGGRRKVKYRFPYKDGQTTDDLGRKPEQFDVDCIIHGRDYMIGLTRLLAELNKPTPGDLIHPVRGSLRVVPEEWSITHTYEQRNAVQLRLVFSEHNFTVGDFRQVKDPSVKGALAKALDAFAKLDAIIANVEGAVIFVKTQKARITEAIEAFKTAFSGTLTSMNASFNTGSSADIPALLPVNEGGVGGGGSGANFPVVASPSDPFASAPATLTGEAATALAVAQLTKDVNSLRADLDEIMALMSAGEGALEFYDDILALKNIGIDLQDALEKGVASSQAEIKEYVAPRLMTIREVAFENGIDVDRVEELELLNPDLLSVNFIDPGTVLKVFSA